MNISPKLKISAWYIFVLTVIFVVVAFYKVFFGLTDEHYALVIAVVFAFIIARVMETGLGLKTNDEIYELLDKRLPPLKKK